MVLSGHTNAQTDLSATIGNDAGLKLGLALSVGTINALRSAGQSGENGHSAMTKRGSEDDDHISL